MVLVLLTGLLDFFPLDDDFLVLAFISFIRFWDLSKVSVTLSVDLLGVLSSPLAASSVLSALFFPFLSVDFLAESFLVESFLVDLLLDLESDLDLDLESDFFPPFLVVEEDLVLGVLAFFSFLSSLLLDLDLDLESDFLVLSFLASLLLDLLFSFFSFFSFLGTA